MDRSSKYYIVANAWLIATTFFIVTESLLGSTFSGVAAIANVIAHFSVEGSETP